jgi:hypothetical protein
MACPYPELWAIILSFISAFIVPAFVLFAASRKPIKNKPRFVVLAVVFFFVVFVVLLIAMLWLLMPACV